LLFLKMKEVLAGLTLTKGIFKNHLGMGDLGDQQ
jgi:hypothetical protein